MLPTFFRNALLVLCLNLLVKGVYLFGIERTVQNRLPEGDYGLYFSLLGLAMLLQVVADAGLQLYNSRTVSGHRQLLVKYFPYFILLKGLLGGAFFLALLLAAWVLGYDSGAVGLLLLVGSAQLLNSLVLYLRSSLAGLGRYALDSWFSIVDKAGMIAVIGGVLLFFPERLNIYLFAGTQVLCWMGTVIGLAVVLRGRVRWRLPKVRRATLWMLLRGGLPFAIAILLQAAYTRTDAVMIERLLVDGVEAAGHYAAGYRLLDALNTVGWLLAGLLLPMYARLHARGQGVGELLGFSVRLLLTVGIVAGVSLAAYAEENVYLLYDFAEPRTATILFFLSLTFIAQCLNYAYGALLSATGYIGRANYLFVVGILLNVAGNLWALPRFGAPGAAAVTLATQGFVAVGQAGLAHRWLGLGVGVIGYGRLLLLGLLLTATALVPGSGLPWGVGFCVLGLIGLGLSFVIGVLRWQQLINWLGRSS
jgi:O-antigen/teichoic acid export membrane protein